MILALTTAPKVPEWPSYGKILGKILVQKVAERVPELPSYRNFRMVTKNPHFLKKFKGGTKGNFSKIAQKVARV